jgi:hypothetical protein
MRVLVAFLLYEKFGLMGRPRVLRQVLTMRVSRFGGMIDARREEGESMWRNAPLVVLRKRKLALVRKDLYQGLH